MSEKSIRPKKKMKDYTPVEVGIEVIKFASGEGSAYVNWLLKADQTAIDIAFMKIEEIKISELLSACHALATDNGVSIINRIYSERDAMKELYCSREYLQCYIDEIQESILDVAVKMMEADMPVPDIIEITGLTEYDIEMEMDVRERLKERIDNRSQWKGHYSYMWENNMIGVTATISDDSYKQGYAEGAIYMKKMLCGMANERLVQIVTNLLEAGFSDEDISRYTACDEKTIERTKTKMSGQESEISKQYHRMTPMEICIEFIKFINREESEFVKELVRKGVDGQLYNAMRKVYSVTAEQLLNVCKITDWGKRKTVFKEIKTVRHAELQLEKIKQYIEGYALGRSGSVYETVTRMKHDNVSKNKIMKVINCNEFDIEAAECHISDLEHKR